MSATPPQDPSPGMVGAGEPYTRNQPRIVDRCPACGSRSLFIGAGGFLTCSVITCANPATGDAIESLRAELSTARGRIAEVEKERESYRLRAEEESWPFEWQVATELRVQRDAALAQVTALREALARVFTIPGWCHSDPDAYLVVQAALAPAVTATPSPTEEVMPSESALAGRPSDVTGAAHPSNTPMAGVGTGPEWWPGLTRPATFKEMNDAAHQAHRAWMQKHEECAAALLRAERAGRVLAALVRQVYEHKNRGEHDDMADEGCPDCTHGTVPDRSNKGRCPYHSAVELLRQTEGK